ncbi:extracellular solute-binding protein [Clostridiaceae bacterium M8S5]|nr:extracellular solute-binding protein [Clostridiaceae bacterium M8S5]
MKRLICAMLSLMMILSFTACSNDKTENVAGSQSNKKSSDKILIYLSGSQAMIDKLEAEFEKDRGDVADFLTMSCGQVRSKVWTEKEAGQIQADVIWGSDPLIYNKLDDQGLLEKIEVKNMESMNEEYIIKNRNYIYINERYITIMYNKKAFKDSKVPQSYEDLLKEQYTDKLVMADANRSSTALGIASSIYQIKNENIDYFKQLQKNGVYLAKSNGIVPSKILEGEFDLGIGPHDSVIRLRKKAKKEGYEMPVDIIWPAEGAISIKRPIAIVKNKNRSDNNNKVAKEFVNFMLSKKAQMITNNFGFVSVRKDIENKYLPKDIKKCNIDWKKATDNEDNFKKQYEQIFQD